MFEASLACGAVQQRWLRRPVSMSYMKPPLVTRNARLRVFGPPDSFTAAWTPSSLPVAIRQSVWAISTVHWTTRERRDCSPRGRRSSPSPEIRSPKTLRILPAPVGRALRDRRLRHSMGACRRTRPTRGRTPSRRDPRRRKRSGQAAHEDRDERGNPSRQRPNNIVRLARSGFAAPRGGR